ncbi:MAG: DUF3122 domain-containing protein [Synechococcales cyanobacterium RM1_1_8]|nr:DUF3122 domain-containing protein [Synechococcales cyanobacterium RM1_1_8]
MERSARAIGLSARLVGVAWGECWARKWAGALKRGIRQGWAIALASLFLWLGLWSGFPAPAQASIHSYPEGDPQTGSQIDQIDQQVMYRSRLSLRDNQDQAWQTILFKRIKAGQVIDFQLRLISFPGQAELPHPEALRVEQGNFQQWELPDQTLLDPQLQTVVTSLGQYDAKPLIASLERTAPLTLTVTLADQAPRQLLVPPYVLREWLQLKDLP